MKKVLCLYRVSTKNQVSHEDDLPLQRRECMAFIDQHPDWVFYDERLEKGVSGFKVSAKKRDAIIEIRQLAEKKKFDILLVFMFDRLGRREDETPFLVEWFIQHGIEVWSTREGQQQIESRSDKLINYIRYWQAGGESEKTSMRVKAAHTQMTMDGLWRGGLKPYGYKLVHKGRVGKKNRPLYDLEIDEVEGSIVQELFALIAKKGYGTYRAANYLNNKYPNPNKIWTAQTIRSMIRNPIYTGRLHMNDILSEPIENLRLVSDAEAKFAEYTIAQHITRKYPEHRQTETTPQGASKTSVYGASLLSGLLYCSSCGCRLVGTYCTQEKKNKTIHRPVYRDFRNQIKAHGCEGQSVYSAKKIEAAVIEVAKKYFRNIRESVDQEWMKRAKKNLQSQHGKQSKKLQAHLDKLEKQRMKLKEEIMKSLNGASAFDAKTLQEMLAENEASISSVEAQLENIREEKEREESRVRMLADQYEQIIDWSKEFDDANNDTKKMILARLIEQIEVDRDYHLTITFFVTEAEFNGESTPSDVTISTSDHPLKIYENIKTQAG